MLKTPSKTILLFTVCDAHRHTLAAEHTPVREAPGHQHQSAYGCSASGSWTSWQTSAPPTPTISDSLPR